MKTTLFTRGRDRLQVRAEGDVRTITGYGAVFFREGEPGTEYELWPGLVERIMPGAFDRALREDDVRSLFNHDPNFILGRTAAGTLRLSVDAVGLKYEVDPPAARGDVVESVERKDVDGSSFMFEVTEVTWRQVDQVEYREIRDVKLWECGPVVFPAYESTTSGIRSGYAARVRQELESRAKSGQPAEIETRRRILARARVVELRERERGFTRLAELDQVTIDRGHDLFQY